MARVADQLGQPLMPWQRLVADVGGEMILDDESGIWVPAYPEVVITVPRQNGKTTEVLVWELDRAFMWEGFDGHPQSIAYTAQSGSEARKKFRNDQVPLLKASPFWSGVESPRFAADDMGIEFKNGSKLTVWNNSKDAGHGSVLDLGVMDEIFADTDDRREQAFLPAMATRHDRQKLVTSTAGDETSVVLTRKQAIGRAGVEVGNNEGTAYFEWSADRNEDPEDPETWRRCMPALGYTITERTVRAALKEMRQENGDLAEFSRAWLNIPINSAGMRVIPLDVWAKVCRLNTAPMPVIFAVDINPERSWGSIAVADAKSAELIQHSAGVGWLLERLVELYQKWHKPIALDATGPAGTLIDGLEMAGVPVEKYQAREYAYACQSFYDRCMEETLQIRQHADLDTACAAATKRTAGDGWAWARRSSDADISPLVALTLAVGRAGNKRRSVYEEREMEMTG